MKRFDFEGKKLDNKIDFPTEFQFPLTTMNDELARNERNGWIDSRPLDEIEMSFRVSKGEQLDDTQ
jgi:hypothetical protein